MAGSQGACVKRWGDVGLDTEYKLKLRDQIASEHSPAPFIHGSMIYGSLLLRSLFVLAGGALFLFPALLQSSDKIKAAEFIGGPGPFFVAAIICAAIATTATYQNLRLNAEFRAAYIGYSFTLAISDPESEEYKSAYKDLTRQAEKLKNAGRGINWYMYASFASAFVGYACFVAGCYYCAILALD